jgi:hypothetical protein
MTWKRAVRGDGWVLTRWIQLSEVTESGGLSSDKSHSFFTSLVCADHVYTDAPSPTASTFCELQSIKLR